jgi:hypothetical protein
MFNLAKFASLAVGTLILISSSSVALATESSGVGAKPANPREDNPRSSSIFVHEIEPGNQVKDAVLVSNNSGISKNIIIYPTDAQVSSGGAFACEQKADELNQEGGWIKLEKKELQLKSNSSESIGFTINVPKDASVGEHNACIAIQAIEAPAKSDINGVTLSFRSAIRVAVTVPGEYDKQLSFESLNIKHKNSSTMLVTQSLKNSGNVSLDTDMDTRLKTVIGITASEGGGEYPILAGQTAEFNFELKKPIWGGIYKLNADASYDESPDTSLGQKSQSNKTINKSKYILLAPHPLVSMLYVIIVLVAIYAFNLKREKDDFKKLAKEKSITHLVKSNENLMGIAQIYDSDWKQTAKLNKIKAPYTLIKGSELSVIPGESYNPPKTKTPKNNPLKKKSSKTVKKTKHKTKETKTKKPNK